MPIDLAITVLWETDAVPSSTEVACGKSRKPHKVQWSRAGICVCRVWATLFHFEKNVGRTKGSGVSGTPGVSCACVLAARYNGSPYVVTERQAHAALVVRV